MAQIRSDRSDLVRLDGKQNHVLRASLANIPARAHRAGMHLAAVLQYQLDSAAADGLQIRSACDERHFLSGGSEPCTQIAADCSGTDDCDSHSKFPER